MDISNFRAALLLEQLTLHSNPSTSIFKATGTVSGTKSKIYTIKNQTDTYVHSIASPLIQPRGVSGEKKSQPLNL